MRQACQEVDVRGGGHDSIGAPGTRSGVVATEFALICPLVVLFAAACADFGRVSHYYEVVANAARTAAETGATQQFTSFTRSAWEDRIREAAVSEMQSLHDFDAGEMGYDLSVTETSGGYHQITVEVSYAFHTAVAWPGLPSEVPLSKRVTYRQFR